MQYFYMLDSWCHLLAWLSAAAPSSDLKVYTSEHFGIQDAYLHAMGTHISLRNKPNV